MKKTMLLTLLSVALAGCAGGNEAASNKEYDDLVAKAKAEITLANKTGYTWRDTEKHLKEADEAMKKGDSDKAMKLAKKAINEAQLAQKQAKDNANVKPAY